MGGYGTISWRPTREQCNINISIIKIACVYLFNSAGLKRFALRKDFITCVRQSASWLTSGQSGGGVDEDALVSREISVLIIVKWMELIWYDI